MAWTAESAIIMMRAAQNSWMAGKPAVAYFPNAMAVEAMGAENPTMREIQPATKPTAG